LYLFQLQLLFSFIERPTQKHYVTLVEEDLNLVKQAIHDLKIYFDHYTNVLKQDSNEYFFPIFELNIGQFRNKHMNLHVKGIESWIKDEILNKKLYNRKFLVSKQEYDFVINESNIVDWNFFTQLIFGHGHLKKGQVETLHQFFINNEHETITCAILPTGYGKSLIYQLVSFLTPKVSVVVTPTPLLISDQLYNLDDNHFNQMAGNFLSQKEFRVGQSDYLLYYTTADLIYGETFTRFIKNMAPYLNMLIVDEVHQISLWSHNFDVNYLVVPNFLNRYFSNSKILFTTATASKRVRSDFNVKFSPRSIDYVMPEAMSRKTIDHEICDVESIDDIVNDLIERFDREYDSGEDLDLRKNNRILIINNDYNIRKKIYELLSNQEFLVNYIMLFNGEEFSYEKFRNGVKKILVSSDDFNIGINIEKISSVITIMNPLSKEWFYQESGRISRNDSHGKALTYIISDSTVGHDELFKNISEDFFDELSVYKKYKSHSNLKRFFDYFTVIEKEKYNLMQLYNGLLKHNNGKSSLMFVPDEGEIYYNNALHFGFILGFIKDWTVQNRKRYDGFKEFKVEIGELNSDNHETLILENAIIFVKKYNVFSPITEWFVNFQGDYEEKLGAFVTWYYISKAYQQFDAMRSVVDMLSNEVPQSPQTNENIEKELELLFVTKKILHDIQQKSKINFNSLSEKAAKKSSSDELADNYIIEKENITNNKNKKQTINKPSQEDHNSEKIINDKPANDHKDKSFIESITSNNHDINSFEQLLNGFDTLGRQLNWQDLKLLVKNPYFMNGKNDMYFKVFFEEKLAEEYSEFFTACLGYYEIKNNIRISRLRTLYHELNTEDIIEFTRLLIKEFNPQIYNRHDFIELVYKEIGYESAYYLFQESNSSKFLVKLYAYVDNFNMEVN
ncbi:MAG: DEAD/DEAH box helicase, partial [bacterium]